MARTQWKSLVVYKGVSHIFATTYPHACKIHQCFLCSISSSFNDKFLSYFFIQLHIIIIFSLFNYLISFIKKKKKLPHFYHNIFIQPLHNYQFFLFNHLITIISSLNSITIAFLLFIFHILSSSVIRLTNISHILMLYYFFTRKMLHT